MMIIGGVQRSFEAWHYVNDNPRDEPPFTNLKGGRIELIDFKLLKNQYELKKYQRVHSWMLKLQNLRDKKITKRIYFSGCKWFQIRIDSDGYEEYINDSVIISLLRGRDIRPRDVLAGTVGHIPSRTVHFLAPPDFQNFLRYGWCAIHDPEIDMEMWYNEENKLMKDYVYNVDENIPIDIVNTNNLTLLNQYPKEYCEQHYEMWKIAPGLNKSEEEQLNCKIRNAEIACANAEVKAKGRRVREEREKICVEKND
jgi:hypothetical protein